MRWITLLLPALLTTLGPATSPARAEGWVVMVTETVEWIDESDPRFASAEGDVLWAEASDGPPRLAYMGADAAADRAIASYRANAPSALAAYGPFRVIDPTRAALVGVTDAASPAAFAAMLAAYPGLATLELVEAPGTENDRANLAIGRMIRAAGLTTRVPDGGSVRSGAVELLLAGARREIADGASFAVHAWRDNRGREAGDFPEDAPEHRSYLDYYREMGMSVAGARAFYAMTNAAPHARARWLDAADMRGWIARTLPANDNPPNDRSASDHPVRGAAPRIAYLDVTAATP